MIKIFVGKSIKESSLYKIIGASNFTLNIYDNSMIKGDLVLRGADGKIYDKINFDDYYIDDNDNIRLYILRG